MKKFITTESVSSGHPDKIADIISDTYLDYVLRDDPNAKVAVETLVKGNNLILSGETSISPNFLLGSRSAEEINQAAYERCLDAYKHALGNSVVLGYNFISEQSPEINKAVVSDSGTMAGDQGFMFGYACSNTSNRLPQGVNFCRAIIKLGHFISNDLGDCPDMKSQITMFKKDISSIVLSSVHKIPLEDYRFVMKNQIKEYFNEYFPDYKLGDIFINPAGEWRIGGPIADCGLTGRKIVVDQYGPYCPVGGGAFSGKDPSKVDRSGAYAARFLAVNILETLKNFEVLKEDFEVIVYLSYIIGKAEPSCFSVEIKSKGDSNYFKLSKKSYKFILDYFDLKPDSIINKFNLKSPIYRNVTRVGHFGELHPWEQVDQEFFHNLYKTI